jgi:hypothetical protein
MLLCGLQIAKALYLEHEGSVVGNVPVPESHRSRCGLGQAKV